MVSVRITGKTVLLALAVVVVLESSGILLLRVLKTPSLPTVGVFRLLEAISFLYLLRGQGGLAATVGIRGPSLLRDTGRGLLWSAGFGLVVLAILSLVFLARGRLVDLLPFAHPSPLSLLPVLLAVGAFISPVAEELFFRGILYGYLRRWGFLPALVLSTALFAFIHPPGQGFPVTQVIGGVLFATAYEVEKSLVVPMVIHGLGNGAIFLLSYYPELF